MLHMLRKNKPSSTQSSGGLLGRQMLGMVAVMTTVLPSCAHLHYERHEPDGTLIIAEVTEFATDAGLEGFRYQADNVSVSIDARNQAQSQALGIAIEAAVKAALKSVIPVP